MDTYFRLLRWQLLCAALLLPFAGTASAQAPVQLSGVVTDVDYQT